MLPMPIHFAQARAELIGGGSREVPEYLTDNLLRVQRCYCSPVGPSRRSVVLVDSCSGWVSNNSTLHYTTALYSDCMVCERTPVAAC